MFFFHQKKLKNLGSFLDKSKKWGGRGYQFEECRKKQIKKN